METGSNQPHSETKTRTEGSEASQQQPHAIAMRVAQARDALRQRAQGLPELWTSVRKRPVLGVGIAVGSGLAVAAVVGAAEAAVALSAGLLAWQALTRPANVQH
jgi:hypothetical protein